MNTRHSVVCHLDARSAGRGANRLYAASMPPLGHAWAPGLFSHSSYIYILISLILFDLLDLLDLLDTVHFLQGQEYQEYQEYQPTPSDPLDDLLPSPWVVVVPNTTPCPA